MNPPDRGAQADNIPVALFLQNGKPGIFVKKGDLAGSGIIPGIYRRFLFSHVPGRIYDEVTKSQIAVL